MYYIWTILHYLNLKYNLPVKFCYHFPTKYSKYFSKKIGMHLWSSSLELWQPSHANKPCSIPHTWVGSVFHPFICCLGPWPGLTTLGTQRPQTQHFIWFYFGPKTDKAYLFSDFNPACSPYCNVGLFYYTAFHLKVKDASIFSTLSVVPADKAQYRIINFLFEFMGKREREIKFISLFENRGHRSPYSPYKLFNHNLYIGIIIFPHIDNPQYTGYDLPKKKPNKIINEKSEGPINLTNHWRKRLWISLHVDLKTLN